MGRKKVLEKSSGSSKKPFCFYCDRTFEEEAVLVQHQRAKHFHCADCSHDALRGKCESVQGLIVHTLKAHGKSLARIPNAIEGRESIEHRVYGMEGIPSDVLREKGFEVPESEAPEAIPQRPGVPDLETVKRLIAAHQAQLQTGLGLRGPSLPGLGAGLAPNLSHLLPRPGFPPMFPNMLGLSGMAGMGGLGQAPGIPGVVSLSPLSHGAPEEPGAPGQPPPPPPLSEHPSVRFAQSKAPCPVPPPGPRHGLKRPHGEDVSFEEQRSQLKRYGPQ